MNDGDFNVAIIMVLLITIQFSHTAILKEFNQYTELFNAELIISKALIGISNDSVRASRG